MATRVLIHEHPHRTIALATEDYALIFRHSHPGTEHPHNASVSSVSLPTSKTAASAPRCMVEFASRSSLELHGYRTLTSAKGTLGLITLNNDVFLCVVTGSTEVASVRPGETVQKIFSVEFYCLNRSDYDHGHGQDMNPYPGQTFSSDEADPGGGVDQSESTADHPFLALKKLLNTGNFYYSVDFDLTRRLQDRLETPALTVDVSSLDEGLLWNSYMIRPLLQFRNRLEEHEKEALDHSRMLTSVVRGFVRSLPIPPASNPLRRVRTSSRSATLTVISRLSARRMGTRFNSRGVDDAGNVANFVETETIFYSPASSTGGGGGDICFSYTQIRGSIPIFWESSSSLIPGQQKIQITRSPEATQPAFDKHLELLERTYGAVHIVNLLSASKPGEVELTDRYRYHISHSPLVRGGTGDTTESSEDHHLLRSTEFDFHAHAREAGGYDGAKQIRLYIEPSTEGFVYFLTEDVSDDRPTTHTDRPSFPDSEHHQSPAVVMQQTGVFRVNCLDCLDRTNLIQTLISEMAISSFLSHRSESANAEFWMRHSTLWADNGDALSKIYAGTGALKSSFTRHGKMSLAGAFADARKSATRLYVNNFADKSRQNTIDLLLGRLVGQTPVQLFDPVHDHVTEQLNSKSCRAKYESCQPIYVWCGTMNLNGKLDGLRDDLAPWLHAKSRGFGIDYDVVCVGFQEIVELSPQQIMSTDPGIRAMWEDKVGRCLNSDPMHRRGVGGDRPEEEYVLLRSGQLVGAALMVFVKRRVLSNIRNVEGAIKKTGMSGMAGNKGAVAVRMEIERTSLCVVTAHLAAGFANYEDRNRDYRTIEQGIRFMGGRGIEDHDAVIWLGDFNYRIGLGHEKTMGLVDRLMPPPQQQQPQQHDDGAAGNDVVVKEEVLGKLYENDQLNIQMVAGQVFPWYQEMRVNFLPTYKFDVGTDCYDSSEKGRIPAWCDRVLFKSSVGGLGGGGGNGGGGSLRGLEYGSVQELRFSDHRPVYATFELGVVFVDEEKRAKIAKTLEEKRKAEVEGILSREKSPDDIEDNSPTSDSADVEDLMGYESIADGLPPASSDGRKWWLDGDRPVRSAVGPPRAGMVLNGRRSANPWRDLNGRTGRVGSGEDDWVEVSASDANGAENVGSAGRDTVSGRSSRTESPRGQEAPPPPSSRGARRMVVPVFEGERLARQASEKVKGGHKVSRYRTSDGAADTQDNASARESPVPPPHASVGERSRTASIASTRSSLTTGKMPPPKPSKPAALTSTPSMTRIPQPTSVPLQTHAAVSTSRTEEEAPPPLPKRTATVSSVGSGGFVSATENATGSPIRRNLPPPVQPRKASRPQEVAGAATSISEDNEAAPPLPPRRVFTDHGLMDDDDGGESVDGWKPLTPR